MQEQTQARPSSSAGVVLNPIIRGLVPGLTEIGKIKIGIKGTWTVSGEGNKFQPPKKLDHFLVTTLERSGDGNYIRDAAIHKIIGDEKPHSIPIVLMFDDIARNFQCRYSCYEGTVAACIGDGEKAIQGDKIVDCPCERAGRDYKGKHKCKFNGVLSVIIRGAERVGGCWKFRTTSRNTVQGIYSSLVLIQHITRGPIAGIPLNLILNPKAATSPDGKAQTVYVVGIEYPHAPEKLQEEGLKLLSATAQYGKRLELAAADAERIVSGVMPEEENAEFIEEFYPEEAEAAGSPSTTPEPDKKRSGRPPKTAPVQEPEPPVQEPDNEPPATDPDPADAQDDPGFDESQESEPPTQSAKQETLWD